MGEAVLAPQACGPSSPSTGQTGLCLWLRYVLFFVGLFEECGLRAVGRLPLAPNAQAAGAAATGPSDQGSVMHGYQAATDAEGAIDQAVEGPGTWGSGPGTVLAGQPGWQRGEWGALVQGRCLGDGDFRGGGS